MDIGLLDIFWAIVYIVSFFGSLSFGYLILRFNIPDIRIVPRESKLGLSGIIGIVLFLLSFAVSYFIGYNFLLFIPLWTLVFTGLFMVQQTLFSKKDMSIAVPVVRMEAPVFSMHEKKVVVRPAAGVAKVLEERTLSERGAFVRESYPQTEEKLIVERKEPTEEAGPAKPEIVPEEEEKYIKSARERYKDRLAHGEILPEEPEERPERRRAREEPEKVAESRRSRYLMRRGEMIEEAKSDMFRASEKKELRKAEKELFEESAPASEVSVEELSEGLDVADLEKIGSLDELGEMGLGGLGSIGERDLEELAGLAEPERVPKQKGMGCPKCGSSNASIVYCPYCGKGFCSNCSDKVSRKGELIFYGCPVCKKEVIVKAES